MIVVIDNYDSFTYNLVQYFGVLTSEIKIFRNDKIDVQSIRNYNPDLILISPGPKSPSEAGISKDCIREYAGIFPVFGVCLGHQAIGEVFGGIVTHAPLVMHGKVSRIFHDDKVVFKGLPQGFGATRYHSLMIAEDGFPEESLEITARTEDGIIMGVRHKKYPIEGVQFHPESILTQNGMEMIRKVYHWALDWKAKNPQVKDKIVLTRNEPEKVLSGFFSQYTDSCFNGTGKDSFRERLQRDDFCSSCGLCIGICSQIHEFGERIRITGDCSRSSGTCVECCPWTEGEDSLTNTIFTRGIGSYNKLCLSYAVDPIVRTNSQYGGTVSAVIHSIFSSSEQGLSVLTCLRDEKGGTESRPAVIRESRLVQDCAGSRYTAIPLLRLLPAEIKDKNLNKLYIVGRGCQIRAARRYIRILPPEQKQKVAGFIGLFCMWALDYKKLTKKLNEISIQRPWHFDIGDDGLVISNELDEKELIPADIVKTLIRDSCHKCGDFTAERADISVGWAKGRPGYNTLIIRNETGEELINKAVNDGHLKLNFVINELVQTLSNIAQGKKERAKTNSMPFVYGRKVREA